MNKYMTKDQIRQALIAIAIGAITAFFSSLFDGLAELLKGHAPEAIGGVVATGRYLINKGRA